MTTQPSSSPSSSEISATPHPYQSYDDRFVSGPKGAFETRKFKGGLYVRVDMPGVPNDGVKVIKYNDTRTVTFTGKAPPLWPGFDSSNPRVYAGYVVLDRDPEGVKFTSDVEDGVLRLFFPRCDGSLHFLSSPRLDVPAPNNETGQEEQEDRPGGTVTSILHNPLEPSGIVLCGGNQEHINPYLLSGVKGVYEHKIVSIKDEEPLIYVRLDIPGTPHSIVMENFGGLICFGGNSILKANRFDEGPREYLGILQTRCDCCKYQVVKHDTANGVVRFLVRKSNEDPKVFNPFPSCHISLPPATPGGHVQSKSVKILGQ